MRLQTQRVLQGVQVSLQLEEQQDAAGFELAQRLVLAVGEVVHSLSLQQVVVPAW